MGFDSEQRKLAAIMFTDRVDGTALMHERAALEPWLLREHLQLTRNQFKTDPTQDWQL